MNTLDLLNKGSKKLKYKGIKSSQIDSEILLSNILGKSRENILINLDKKICSNDIIKFNDFIERRSLKEPIAYILKEKEFIA
jgi:release factor glutamine methyltransferase